MKNRLYNSSWLRGICTSSSLTISICILGNEMMHQLTSGRRIFSLRVDLESYEGSHIYAKYDNFSVGPESDNYTLHVTGFVPSSTAGE